MALQLFKLAGRTLPAITTSQTTNQYWHIMSATVAVASGSTFTVAAANWTKGNGSAATALATGAGSTDLNINGVLQQPGIYTVSSTTFTLTAPAGGITLHNAYPLTLQTYNANTVLSTTSTFAIN